MDRTFENPQNGHRESFSDSAWLWSLLFGWIYLLAVGLWGHVFIQIFIVVVCALIGGGPAVVLVMPILWIVYAASINTILANRYLRQGWREVQPGSVAGTGLESEASRQARLGLQAPAQAAATAPAMPVATPPAGPAPFVADELVKLADLRDKGVLTPDEFTAQKARLLAGGPPVAPAVQPAAAPAQPSGVVAYGRCSKCEAQVRLDATSCPNCTAAFNEWSTWKILRPGE